MADDKFYVATHLRFTDGGEDEFMVLARDLKSIEDCERIIRVIPAVSYSGDRPVKDAELIWGKGEV